MDTIDCTKEMAQVLSDYNHLRGMSAEKCVGLFWDVVVFSVADETQREAFKEQIVRLKFEKAIPLVDYIAIEDVPDYKMGSGGATMHILSKLKSRWGWEKLASKKILLVHTGGQCRRLPQHSALGKLFARLPLPLERKRGSTESGSVFRSREDPMPSAEGTMLDLKLAMYLPFCRKMTAGVFLTASDDIELYAIDGDFYINPHGFTGLAHPTPCAVASRHGVYVLPETVFESCTNTPCNRVMQKPTLKEMDRLKAIIAESFAYTDSAFAFGMDVAKALINYYEQHKPLNEEICAYRDFLTCLGMEAPRAKRPLQKMLQKFELSIVVLPKSTFYHIGTLAEYLDHLCSDRLFKKQLGLGDGSSMSIHSRVSTSSPPEAAGRYVIEFCDFSRVTTMKFGADCVLHGCQVEAEEIEVPERVVMFTVAITAAASSSSGVPPAISLNPTALTPRFETSALVMATSKTSAMITPKELSRESMPPTSKIPTALAISSVKGLSKRLQSGCITGSPNQITTLDNMSYVTFCFGIADDLKIGTQLFGRYETGCCLWEARLFRAMPTRSESFLATLQDIAKPMIDEPGRYSMRNALKLKCINEMLDFQMSLMS